MVDYGLWKRTLTLWQELNVANGLQAGFDHGRGKWKDCQTNIICMIEQLEISLKASFSSNLFHAELMF